MENVFCRPQKFLFYSGYVMPVAVLYLTTLISYCVSFFLIYCFEMTSAEKQFRKDSVISHYYAGLILFIIFGVVWVFAITGTQYNITGPGSTALQYVFGSFSMIHALLLVILTFARTSDTRLAFRPIARMIPGRTGKYEFAADTRGAQETYGLDISGKYLTDETKMARADEKEPLAVSNIDEDDEPRYVTSTSVTVVVNEDALEGDEKTEL
ncbi:PREDICTED: uncharacterized protein LOC109583726 [Amphimedon queenslandica]|nr:PREDICTED: uncharacterized protein LOC109583726 [Amphimedon queenslandica]|eukprot:XP_019854730.1 PREDICTED: uncharacterized protein LOC109583726 [Amphimedon queenslandica]